MVRPVQWTDEQLELAISNSSSWIEVIKKLGRRPNTAARLTVAGHALRLGLDVSHLESVSNVKPLFRSGVGPSRDVLYEAVVQAKTWRDVLQGVGMGISSSDYRKIQRASKEYGIDTSHLSVSGGVAVPDSVLPFSSGASLKHLRRSGVALAIHWFLDRGYMASIPVDAAPYDLVAESDLGLRKIQVKTATVKANKVGSYSVSLVRHEYGSERHSNGYYWNNRPYKQGEIDLFFVITGSKVGYLFPIECALGQLSVTLNGRFDQYKISIG